MNTEITVSLKDFMELAQKAAKYDLIAEAYPVLPNYTRDEFIQALTGKGKKEEA